MKTTVTQQEADLINDTRANLNKGNKEAAQNQIDQLMALNPQNPEAYHLQGLLNQNQGNSEAATEDLKKAIELNPCIFTFHLNLGVIQIGLKQNDEAEESFQEALKLNPDSAEAHNNLGAILIDKNKVNEGITHCYLAIALKPDYMAPRANLANGLRILRRHSEAAHHLEVALKHQPKNSEAWTNLALLMENMRKFPEAEEYYQKAISCNPDHPKPRFIYSLFLLLQGNLEKGFLEYEYRKGLWKSRAAHFTQPEWDGQPLAGKTLFVHAEQGMGDSIQFIRYLNLIEKQGGKLIFEVDKPLMELCLQIQNIDQILTRVTTDKYLPDFDMHISLLSIPKVLKTTLDNIPAEVPYLYPPKIKKMELQISKSDLFKIGFVWAGNPAYANDHNRSSELNFFTTLFTVPNIQLFCLQKGDASEKLINLHPGKVLQSMGERVESFVDTADVISQLDLIISVDTAVAHLAGAMAKLVWLLVPFSPDWRWLMHRHDTPWYPTMRLFRQQQAGDWAEVFNRIRDALLELTQK